MLHPADQFEAFRALVDKGADTADIAARFGVPESTVQKRLKLGRVAPAILDAYRAGELGLEQVQAFTVSDDHEAQERVFAACNGHRASAVIAVLSSPAFQAPQPSRRIIDWIEANRRAILDRSANWGKPD